MDEEDFIWSVVIVIVVVVWAFVLLVVFTSPDGQEEFNKDCVNSLHGEVSDSGNLCVRDGKVVLKR